ncbi:glycosyltransferase [Patescibacteria group bacterium]|nr:glycosyltransferase [Patescibacteria group bacterium]MBU4482323.1 glycosyltransferase [Patescibacteria group bacterium]
MKTLIIHDRFQFRGGAERLVLIMAKALNADILTEFWIDNETFDKTKAPNKLFILDKGDPNLIVWRYFRAQKNFIFKTRKIIRKYDLIIFSGNNCLSASIHLKKTQKYFLYCHAPVRHVFDLFKKFRSEQKSLWKKIIYYNIGAWGIRIIYWLGLLKFKTVIANSKNVQNRLWKYCRKKSQVIWPPIQTNKFKWVSQGDYYLSFGRVDKLKRTGDIVRAFQQMPDKKLIISSGGDDLENIKNLAENYKNIQVLGWVSDEELKNLVGNCIASIYIPIDEDAGMAPLEANSAGKPAIVNYDGGLKEIIQDEINGKFISKNYTIEEIKNAVKWMTPDRAMLMKKDCESQAKNFSEEIFIEKTKNVIENL